jgi:hypothetical protein
MLIFCKTTVHEKQGFDFATRPRAATGAVCSGLISYSCSIYSCDSIFRPTFFDQEFRAVPRLGIRGVWVFLDRKGRFVY